MFQAPKRGINQTNASNATQDEKLKSRRKNADRSAIVSLSFSFQLIKAEIFPSVRNGIARKLRRI